MVQSIPNPDLKQNNCEENEAVLEPLTEGEIVEIPSIEKESKKESFSKPSEVSADKNKPQVSEAPIESQQAFGTESTVSNGCNESFKQKEDHLKGNVDLKSLVQTKDMGSCEKLAKSRNSLLKNKSCYMSELTEIRLRTIAQFKGNQGRKDSKKKVSTLSGSCSKPESSRSKTNLDTKTVHEGSVKTLTKDIAVCKEMPKKRRSKSETDSSVHLKEPKDNSPKRRSVSDSAKVLSDDDEFILRLSGDEKEETERESIVAEMQVTSLPNEVMKDLQVPVVTSKTTVTKTSITTPESSSKPVLPSKQRVNDVSKRVDSKAADNVLQALLEKGFNYSLPSLPSTRIKKIAPNVKSEDSQKKSAEPVIDSRAQKPSPASTLSESKLLKSSENSTKINECSDDVNEEMSETVNTSITNFTREVIVKYSGLGPTKPKIDVFPISAKQLVQMDDGSISLSPSNFFSLYNINPKVNTSEADSERRRRRIDSTRTGPEGCSAISRYSNSRNSRNTRTRGLRDSNSGDRGAMRREGNQSRRNQSPPPRHRHSRDYSNDRSHYRDSHYSQEYYDRSKRDSRKEEASSSRSRKPSDCRSAKALKPYPKVSSIDAEDGEILSSDGEFETKTSSKRVRPSSQEKKKSMRENRTVQESVSRRKETDQSSSTSKPKPIIRHRICPPSTSGKVNYNLESDEMNDLDLDDDANFPVLGDDDLEENDCKGTDQNSSKESNSSGGMVLRRAPPRSVNAHKVSETQTPTQRGKRKLSISPDVVSEDSCQSILSVVNPDGKQMQSSRQTKKRLSTTSGKVLKSSENEDVANCSEIIKNLNVDAFLSKIHG
ncbi:hypothetical protein FOCC_FOCC007539 [Frankliniella occidentalis]|nr:hypothetical protein FOCC_FOCC007539 [Frankliniella occidentalis]